MPGWRSPVKKDIEIIDVTETLPWNTNGQKWDTRSETKIKFIVVHQALGTKTVVGTNKYSITNSPNMALGRGSPRIPYHFFIEPDGKIYQCNKIIDLTCTVKNMNTVVLSICLGGFYSYQDMKTRDGNPPKIQLKSLESLLNYLVQLLKLTNKDVRTHDELQGKPSCPGTVAAEFVKQYKESTT